MKPCTCGRSKTFPYCDNTHKIKKHEFFDTYEPRSMLKNLNDYMQDYSMYNVSQVKLHPNYHQVEENIHVIKNFTTQEERDWFLNIAQSAEEDDWGKDDREWWNKKILFIGEKNLNHPILITVMQRIKDLFDDKINESWAFGGSSSIHRMQEGEAMFVHADNPSGTHRENNYVQFGLVLYHNDFDGGEVIYPELNLEYKPSAGDLLMHPGTTKYTHGTKPVLNGSVRYISTAWVFDPKVKKVRDKNMVFDQVDTGEITGDIDPITKYQK